MMLKSNNILLILMVGFVVMACQDAARPSDVLSESDFEDVLYDLHLSHYIEYDKQAGDTLSEAAHRYALTRDVLKKYDITQAEWDSSVVYYTRHSVQLNEMYDHLYERLSYLTDGNGVGENSKDSADIWRDERHLLLSSQRGNTSMQWTLKTDTLLKPGEKVNIQYLCLFLNSQAQSRLMTVLTIRLKNDSVIVRNQISHQTGVYNVIVEDDQKIGIKSVSGYFMVMRPTYDMFGSMDNANQKSKNAKQVISIANITLTHEPPKDIVPKNNANENASDTVPDASHPQKPDGAATPPKARLMDEHHDQPVASSQPSNQ